MLAGCVADGRSPDVGVGVSVGGGMPPPVIAEAPRGGPPPWAPTNGCQAKEGLYGYVGDSRFFERHAVALWAVVAQGMLSPDSRIES